MTLEDVIEQLIQEEIWDETDPRIVRNIQRQVSLARAKTKKLSNDVDRSFASIEPSSHGATSAPVSVFRIISEEFFQLRYIWPVYIITISHFCSPGPVPQNPISAIPGSTF